MGEIIGDGRCPSCESVGRDSSSNHLMEFEDGGKFCNKCGYSVNKDGKIRRYGNLPEGEKIEEVMTPESTTQLEFGIHQTTLVGAVHPTPTLPTMGPESLPSAAIRSIPKNVIEMYGVKVEYDTSTREIVKHYYPMRSKGELITWKCRDVASKKFFKLAKTSKNMDLFGQHLSKGRVPPILIITEGELDTCAVYHMLSKIKGIQVVSLPTGDNIKALQDNIKWLGKIPQIYLCFDQDEAGVLNTARAWELLPNVKVMEFSEKDPCDMLKEMKTQEFIDSFVNAGSFRPRTLVDTASLVDSLGTPVPMGLTYPWEGLNEITYGIHLNSIIGVGAAPKAGKSTLMKAIQFQLMFTHKERIGIIDVEQSADKSFRGLVGYEMGKQIHKPGVSYDVGVAKKIGLTIEPLVEFYAHEYYAGKWEEIEAIIRYLYSMGIKYFFVDPVSALVSHLSPSDQNQYISKAMFSLSKMVQVMDIAVFHVNHLNSPSTGLPHEAGGRIYGSSFTGSRAQYRYSHLLLGMERNQQADTQEERDKTLLRIAGDRLTGNTGRYTPLIYNQLTGRLDEPVVTSVF